MKKGVWNEIIYRLTDKGITKDPAGLYTLSFQNEDENKYKLSLGWNELIQSLYDEAEKHGIDEIIDSVCIETKI
ncbi:MAG: hypothetical protein HGA59_05575 [Chlorobiaceae bacterium]|jgi:hypothetical protein|nr:hypothetical protein [Chlorobiaceae bacterium]NTV17658.1 hypothetical protein [Chlorobiaceae bacterium]